MKKLLLFVFILVSFFTCCYDVDAKINTKNTEIECIYANGIVIGMGYDRATSKNYSYIKEYPVSESSVITAADVSLSNMSLYDGSDPGDDTVTRLKSLTCPNDVRYYILREYGNEDTVTFKGIYSFNWCTTPSHGCSQTENPIAQALRATETTGWWIFSGTEVVREVIPAYGTGLVNSRYNDGPNSRYPEAVIPLVGERLYFVDDIGEDAYVKTFKQYSSAEQAVSNAKYAQIYKDSNGMTYLQLGSTLTTLTGSVSADWSKNYQWVCISESVVTEDASRGEVAKKFNQIRHKITSVGQMVCGEGSSAYRITNDKFNGEEEVSKEDFCDKYPETAKVLGDVVRIMQILVPAIVIVFTGIEIGRIVVAGNIQEELPKRKKSIIIRLIIMVAFLFLPMITQLIIALAEGVEILEVGCLFE